MSEEIRCINNLLNGIDIENIQFEDEYFTQILNSLVQYFEKGEIKGISYGQGVSSPYFIVYHPGNNGKSDRTRLNVSKREIEKLHKEGLSVEQATLRIKLILIQEAIKLRFGAILEPGNQDEILKFLLSGKFGGIKYIFLEKVEGEPGKTPIMIRIKDNSTINNGFRIFYYDEKADTWKGLEKGLKEAIELLLKSRDIYLTDEYKEVLFNETIEYYRKSYDSMISSEDDKKVETRDKSGYIRMAA